MNRTANVVRMQLVNRNTFIWTPLVILFAAFAITLAIYGIILFSVTEPVDEPMYSGGTQAPLWYFVIVGVYALHLTFPFSQAMSVSRREFFAGTMLTALGTSLVLAVIYLVGGVLEQATDGWGFNGYFFYLPWIWDQGPVAAALFFFAAAVLAFSIGFLGALLYRRFGLTWTIVAGIGLIAALLVSALSISATDSWPAVGHALVGAQAVYVALIGLVVAAAVAGLNYLILRRAIP